MKPTIMMHYKIVIFLMKMHSKSGEHHLIIHNHRSSTLPFIQILNHKHVYLIYNNSNIHSMNIYDDYIHINDGRIDIDKTKFIDFVNNFDKDNFDVTETILSYGREVLNILGGNYDYDTIKIMDEINRMFFADQLTLKYTMWSIPVSYFKDKYWKD